MCSAQRFQCVNKYPLAAFASISCCTSRNFSTDVEIYPQRLGYLSMQLPARLLQALHPLFPVEQCMTGDFGKLNLLCHPADRRVVERLTGTPKPTWHVFSQANQKRSCSLTGFLSSFYTPVWNLRTRESKRPCMEATGLLLTDKKSLVILLDLSSNLTYFR